MGTLSNLKNKKQQKLKNVTKSTIPENLTFSDFLLFFAFFRLIFALIRPKTR